MGALEFRIEGFYFLDPAGALGSMRQLSESHGSQRCLRSHHGLVLFFCVVLLADWICAVKFAAGRGKALGAQLSACRLVIKSFGSPVCRRSIRNP